MTNEEIAKECEARFQAGGPRVYIVERNVRIVPSPLSAKRATQHAGDDERVYARCKSSAGGYVWAMQIKLAPPIYTKPGLCPRCGSDVPAYRHRCLAT